VKNLALQDLSTLLWALAQLQLQPSEDVVCELCERSWPCIPACDVTQLTIIVWALGRLQARPGRAFLEAAEAASMQVCGLVGVVRHTLHMSYTLEGKKWLSCRTSALFVG
jgi:hypothetical protein